MVSAESKNCKNPSKTCHLCAAISITTKYFVPTLIFSKTAQCNLFYRNKACLMLQVFKYKFCFSLNKWRKTKVPLVQVSPLNIRVLQSRLKLSVFICLQTAYYDRFLVNQIRVFFCKKFCQHKSKCQVVENTLRLALRYLTLKRISFVFAWSFLCINATELSLKHELGSLCYQYLPRAVVACWFLTQLDKR